MALKINKKIVGWAVEGDDGTEESQDEVIKPPLNVNPSYLDVDLPNRDCGAFMGLTYKIKNRASEDAAIYLTVNFRKIENFGHRLCEVFLNCKDAKNLQWETMVTRQISAMARKTGRIGFMIEEMKQVSNATGGYITYIDPDDDKPIRVMGQVAHIGYCIERACRRFNVMDNNGIIIEHEQDMHVQQPVSPNVSVKLDQKDMSESMVQGVDCRKCGGVKSAFQMDGCLTCRECGDSKCG